MLRRERKQWQPGSQRRRRCWQRLPRRRRRHPWWRGWCRIPHCCRRPRRSQRCWCTRTAAAVSHALLLQARTLRTWKVVALQEAVWQKDSGHSSALRQQNSLMLGTTFRAADCSQKPLRLHSPTEQGLPLSQSALEVQRWVSWATDHR